MVSICDTRAAQTLHICTTNEDELIAGLDARSGCLALSTHNNKSQFNIHLRSRSCEPGRRRSRFLTVRSGTYRGQCRGAKPKADVRVHELPLEYSLDAAALPAL